MRSYRHQLNASDTLIRDGLIQRFKVTYEVSCRTLKRYLEATSANPAEPDAMPFQDLIHSGNERGLLREDWPVWRKYRDMRSRTSHTYSEDVALQVVSGIPDFLEEAAYLWQRLNEANT